MPLEFEKFLEAVSRKSEKTAITYGSAIRLWARTLSQDHPDKALELARTDPYSHLDGWAKHCYKTGKTPKTTRTYFGAVKSYMEFGDIELTPSKLKKVVRYLPNNSAVSVDAIPTHEQIRKILIHGDLKSKTVTTVLLSSGMRLGEICTLKVGSVDFNRTPVRAYLNARNTKSGKSRAVYISDEASGFLKEWLGERIKNPDLYIFSQDGGKTPEDTKTIYSMFRRRLIRAGLLFRLDPNSSTNAFHPHSTRKYFFSRCIGAGIDRGIVESWMGHRYHLDTSYLRMSEEDIAREYLKAVSSLTFLSGNGQGETKEEVSRLKEENKLLKEKVTVYEQKLSKYEHKQDQHGEEIIQLSQNYAGLQKEFEKLRKIAHQVKVAVPKN